MKTKKNKNQLENISTSYSGNGEYSATQGVDVCVVCGAVVPEGRFVCWNCEKQLLEQQAEDKD